MTSHLFRVGQLVTYKLRWANGQIEGADFLAQAFRAGGASIALPNGNSVDILLFDPDGDSTAEIAVSGLRASADAR
jgi:hypothetical protein